MGSTFGLYCPPSHRFHLGAFERNENLTPPWRKWVPALERMPKFVQDTLLEEFTERAHDFDWKPAYGRGRRFLRDAVKSLERAQLDLGFDWPEIDIRARELAAASFRAQSLCMVELMARSVGLTLPEGTKESTDATIFARCLEPKTWRKSIEKNYTRSAENHLRKIGFIGRGGMLYCSDLAVAWYRGKMRAQEAYLRSRTVDDGAGTQLELWDVHQKSLSNKSNRRTELMTRMRGFDDYAKAAGDVATFFTLTCPSAFHARSADRGGRASRHNELFAGFSVRESQAWLSKIWARARAALAKKEITIYGFRVAEPHHDGTPHWHMVLFCAPRDRDALCELLRSKWLSEFADEPGALVHRSQAKIIDPAKGSATGYLSKYISKNIDGFGVESEASDEDDSTALTDSALRVTAWASLHGLRQFQQIGGPPVGPYRELRRQRTPVDLPTIEPIRMACDDHRWAEYIVLNGGIEAGRLGKIRPWTRRTGELNAYGEVKAAEVAGVKTLTEGLCTRTKIWRVIRKCGTSLLSSSAQSSPGASFSGSGFASDSGGPLCSDLGPVSITVAGAAELADPHSWTNPNETSTYGPH